MANPANPQGNAALDGAEKEFASDPHRQPIDSSVSRNGTPEEKYFSNETGAKICQLQLFLPKIYRLYIKAKESHGQLQNGEPTDGQEIRRLSRRRPGAGYRSVDLCIIVYPSNVPCAIYCSNQGKFSKPDRLGRCKCCYN